MSLSCSKLNFLLFLTADFEAILFKLYHFKIKLIRFFISLNCFINHLLTWIACFIFLFLSFFLRLIINPIKLSLLLNLFYRLKGFCFVFLIYIICSFFQFFFLFFFLFLSQLKSKYCIVSLPLTILLFFFVFY